MKKIYNEITKKSIYLILDPALKTFIFENWLSSW